MKRKIMGSVAPMSQARVEKKPSSIEICEGVSTDLADRQKWGWLEERGALCPIDLWV